MKKVSVIIPVYNVEEYLDKALESVCNQSYKNLEIILVDDGSTDASAKKCDMWKEKDSRIIIIHKSNGGLSSARNAGLDAASGDYIYFFDSDDYLDSNLLSAVVPYMDNGYDMAAFSYHIVDEKGTLLSNCDYEAGDYIIAEQTARIQYICGVLLPCKAGWAAWSRIYRKETIDRAHLRFADNRRVFAEDLYFCLCYNFYANKVINIQDRLYYYRVRENSIMNKDGVQCNVGRMNELSREVRKLIESDKDLAYLLEIYPVIHFFIINNAISQYLARCNCSLSAARETIRNDLENPDQFLNDLKDIRKYKKLLYPGSTRASIRERLSYIQYLLDGSYGRLRIRNRCIYMLDKITNYRGLPK